MISPKPLTRKLPANRGTFSYARIPQDGGGVVYRLFRRDMNRALHAQLCTFNPDCDRRLIAQRLRNARRRLRDTVDDIDLQIMGVTP